MPSLSVYEYAALRVVPQIERGEFVNAGVILFCRPRRFLAARVALDPARLHALAPGLDSASVQRHLDTIPQMCVGGPEAGPIGALTQAERFHWLVAPRSTMVQPAPVRTGLCSDPAATLAHLLARLVLLPA